MCASKNSTCILQHLAAVYMTTDIFVFIFILLSTIKSVNTFSTDQLGILLEL